MSLFGIRIDLSQAITEAVSCIASICIRLRQKTPKATPDDLAAVSRHFYEIKLAEALAPVIGAEHPITSWVKQSYTPYSWGIVWAASSMQRALMRLEELEKYCARTPVIPDWIQQHQPPDVVVSTGGVFIAIPFREYLFKIARALRWGVMVPIGPLSRWASGLLKAILAIVISTVVIQAFFAN